MSAITATARTLRTMLPPDMHVIASPSVAGRGPILTVLQLVTDSEAAALRPALEHLIAEFRQQARALVDQLPVAPSPASDIDWSYPKTVQLNDTTWYTSPHGEHCRFEDPAGGVVVEANLHAPDTIDPYFLLLYAETSGRHSAILDTCTEGFHDMCRLLDLAGII